jgi:hypothetical protein
VSVRPEDEEAAGGRRGSETLAGAGEKRKERNRGAKGIGTGWDGNRELESSWRLRVRWDKLSRAGPRPRHLVAVGVGRRATLLALFFQSGIGDEGDNSVLNFVSAMYNQRLTANIWHR